MQTLGVEGLGGGGAARDGLVKEEESSLTHMLKKRIIN